MLLSFPALISAIYCVITVAIVVVVVVTVKLLLLSFSCGVKPVSDLQRGVETYEINSLGLRSLRREIRKRNVLHFVLSVC